MRGARSDSARSVAAAAEALRLACCGALEGVRQDFNIIFPPISPTQDMLDLLGRIDAVTGGAAKGDGTCN
jgi:hypothetical protein